MNELVKSGNTGGALAAAQALKGSLRKAQSQLPEVQGLQYLRFLQDGNWVFGQENEQVFEEDRVAFNPLSIKTGWSCWTDRPGRGTKNENMGEQMVALGQDPILKSDLPKYTDPQNGDKTCEWKEQISIDVKVMSGPQKGKQIHYKTTSVGGITAMRALIDQLMLQLDDDPAHIVPVVNLGADHYQHKAYGRTYTPVLSIVDWVSIDGDATTAEPEDEGEDEVEKKPAKKKKVAKKKKPEPEPIEEEEEEDYQTEDDKLAERVRAAHYAEQQGEEQEEEDEGEADVGEDEVEDEEDEAPQPVRRRRRR